MADGEQVPSHCVSPGDRFSNDRSMSRPQCPTTEIPEDHSHALPTQQAIDICRATMKLMLDVMVHGFASIKFTVTIR